MRDGEGSTIERQTRIRGRVLARESLRVRGRIDGPIEGELVLVDQGAVVVGDLDAREVRIEGVVLGRVEARERIWLGATAQVRGALIAPLLGAEVGARADAELAIGDVDRAAVPESSASTPVEVPLPSLSAVPDPDGPRVVVVKKRS